MNEDKHLETLQDIKQMMEKSSRFISLSGLSGIAAGLCALCGAFAAYNIIEDKNSNGRELLRNISNREDFELTKILHSPLFIIAVITFFSALILSFIFTYLRSKKTHTPLWGFTAKRLLINVITPLTAGGCFLFKIIFDGYTGLVAPGCLIFYGLAVLNASKYTLPETRYLGYTEIFTGVVSLCFIGEGLYFWAFGFGVLHITYGIFMWKKYERT